MKSRSDPFLPFDLEPGQLEFCDDSVAMIPLDLDDPGLERSAGAALPFQLTGQPAKSLAGEGDARDGGDTLAVSSLDLEPYPDDAIT